MDYRSFIVYACTQVWRDFTVAERTQFTIIDHEPTCPQFANIPIGFSYGLSGTSTPAFNGPLTTPLPPTWTPLPITLPVFTPISSPTPSATPTAAPPTPTATYPFVVLTFTPSNTMLPSAIP